MPLAFLLAVLAAASFAAAGVVAMAYRRGTPRAWNAVAIFAIGVIIAAYGALEELLCRLGSGCTGSRSWAAITAGLLIAGCGVAYGFWERVR